MNPKAYVRKYFVMGSQDCLPARKASTSSKDRAAVKLTENEQIKRAEEIFLKAAEAGITAFQFREKGPDALKGDAKVKLGLTLRKHCLDYGIPFFINDDVHLVSKLRPDGVHVGQDDEAVSTIKERFPNLQIGLSIGSKEELEASRHVLHIIDYVGAGPVYTTSSKADAGAACGTSWIKELKKELPDMPVVGIGGISTENAADVLQAGADGLAVISAITQASDIKKAVSSL